MVPSYKILTEKTVYNCPNDQWETWSLELWEEQEAKCKELGINTSCLANDNLLHFFDSPFFNERKEWRNVDDGIQCLAIKDGVDLVQFENGNYGFVAYYNGHKNGFEILC